MNIQHPWKSSYELPVYDLEFGCFKHRNELLCASGQNEEVRKSRRVPGPQSLGPTVTGTWQCREAEGQHENPKTLKQGQSAKLSGWHVTSSGPKEPMSGSTELGNKCGQRRRKVRGEGESLKEMGTGLCGLQTFFLKAFSVQWSRYSLSRPLCLQWWPDSPSDSWAHTWLLLGRAE